MGYSNAGYDGSTGLQPTTGGRRWKPKAAVSSKESCNDDCEKHVILDAVTPESIPENLRVRAQKQLEYYFSDKNLLTDSFLLTRTGAQGDGFVSISDFANFRRLVSLAGEVDGLPVQELVVAGVNLSSRLQLSEDSCSIRRRQPLPLANSTELEESGDFIFGKIPNLYWCAIPYDELRCNVNFLPLPPVTHVELCGPATWQWVRQDDPLWQELHWGVLTARHLPGILGFHEPSTVAFLAFPRHLLSHSSAVNVYYHLLDAEDAASSNPWLLHDHAELRNGSKRQSWIQQNCCQSLVSRARAKLKQRKSFLLRSARSKIEQVQCSWGNAQEPSALKMLAESLRPPYVQLEEIGLAMIDIQACSSAAATEVSASSSRRWSSAKRSDEVLQQPIGRLPPLMGASPDAMVRLQDGTRAAVEVKNVCPFFKDGERFSVCRSCPPQSHFQKQRRGPADRINMQHVPQIQWEMLATRTDHTVLLSASACNGSHAFEVRRDEEYLQLMLRLISEFYEEFVLRRRLPGKDFFWDRPHYIQFLELTRAICAKTKLVQKLPGICDARIEAPFLDRAVTPA